MYRTKRKSEYFDVFNQKLAGYLMMNGFVLIKTRPDIKGSGRNVFVFYNTPALRTVIDNYMIQNDK